MKILIIGGLGQLGSALQVALKDYDLTSVDLPEQTLMVLRGILKRPTGLMP